MAKHLGEWNAQIAAEPPALDFPVGRDLPVKSAEQFDFPGRIRKLLALSDAPMVREMYAGQNLGVAGRYVDAYLALVERCKTLPHALSLADCPVSNFFHRPGETIAIDWAGLSQEPVGSDGGRLIGSAMMWGQQFMEVARKERELFESYLEGLRAGGITEQRDTLRSGYLCELGFYLGTAVTLPVMVANPQSTLSHAYFEKRFEMPVAQFGAAFAPLIDLIPSYLEELRGLLAH